VLRVISTSVPKSTGASVCIAGRHSAVVGASGRLTRRSAPSPAGLRRRPGGHVHEYPTRVRHSAVRVGGALTVNVSGKAGEDR